VRELPTIKAYRMVPVSSLPFRPYVYGGTVQLEDDPETDAFVQPCGTSAAARRHYLNGEKPCDACRDAERERWRESKRKSKSADMPMAKGGFTQEKCGTNAGHQRHMYYGVTPCDECIIAHRAYHQARRDRKRAAARAKKEAAA